MLVRCVIIDNEMNVQLRRNTLVQAPEKREKLLMPMSRFTFREYRASRDIQRRKQRGCPVTNIVMRDAFDVAKHHGQDLLRPVESLNLAFLVNAKDQRVI